MKLSLIFSIFQSIYLIAALSFLFIQTEQYNLYFDIGDTLLGFSQLQIARAVPWATWLRYALTTKSSFKNIGHDLRTKLFDILKEAGGEQQATNEGVYAFDSKGNILPKLICDWMTSSLSEEQCKEKINETIRRWQERGLFASDTERTVIHQILLAMFTSKKLAQSAYPIAGMPEILEALAQEKDEHDEKKFKFFILSNFDTDTFERIYKDPKLNRIFRHFPKEQCIISGNEKTMKPHAEIYAKVLPPATFFDDRPENCTAAQNRGIDTFLFNTQNISAFESYLVSKRYLTKPVLTSSWQTTLIKGSVLILVAYFAKQCAKTLLVGKTFSSTH